MTDTSKPGLSITRVFDAPREVVFRAFTQPANFAHWFGGSGATVPVDSVTMDLRPGGRWTATMFAGPDRTEIHWQGQYLEVLPPERLVFTLSDQPGDAAEVATVRLTDLAGRTEMDFHQGGGHLSEAEYARAREGWQTFFDSLADLLVLLLRELR